MCVITGTPGTAERPGTPPSDAIVLIGPGKGLDAWDHQRWSVTEDGVVQVKPGTGDNRTKASFGDCRDFNAAAQSLFAERLEASSRRRSSLFMRSRSRATAEVQLAQISPDEHGEARDSSASQSALHARI